MPSKTMSQLIAEINRAERRIIKHVEPLNKRLNVLDMQVWWSGDDKEWFLNRHSASVRSGISFWLDENKLKKLMTMSDSELRKYCQAWGSRHGY